MLPIRQIAYFVADVRAAARAHHARFGSGPFFVADHVKLARSFHRGRPDATPLDHSSAYGQWGEVMVEFVQQHGDAPSAFLDMYPRNSGRWGLHHVALFVDALSTALAQFNTDGYETALYAETDTGFAFAMVDAVATSGHMIELYEGAQIAPFYDMVRDAARGFDGADLLRPLTLG